MKRATRMPHQPSMRRWAKWPARVAASTAAVAAQSLRESAAVASMAVESSFFPRRRL